MVVEQESGEHNAVVEQPSQGKRSLNVREMWMPLRFKITIPYLFLSLVLAVGAAVLVTQIVFDTVDERFTNQLIEAGKLASERIVSEESRLLETQRLLAYTQGVAEAIQEGDSLQLRELAFGIAVDHQEETVEFINNEGELVLSMHHRGGGRIEEYDFSQGGDVDFSQWGFVQRTLGGNADELGNKFAGFVRAGWGDTMYVAGPVYSAEGQIIGAVLVGKTLPTLVRQIREETLAQVSLYDQDGRLLASTFSEPSRLEKTNAATLLANQDQDSLRRELINQRTITSTFIDYVELLGPWELRGDVDYGIMGTALPKTFLVSASRFTRYRITLLVAAAFALILLVGFNLANLITRPLMSLVRASREVSRGNLDVRLEAQSRDELEILSLSFNEMVSNLNASRKDLVNAYDSTLEGWSKALELRDKDTEGHTRRVAELTVELAKAAGIAENHLIHVWRGAILHDIGKVGIPDAILHKPGPLDKDEWVLMHQHPTYAYEMLKNIDYLLPALAIPHSHHERWDGKGYPRGLQGEEIPLEARIFAIVDVWDALRSDRPYRDAWPDEHVYEYIRNSSGSHFDPEIARLFMQHINKLDKINGL